jgi:hypothetical protein
LPRTQAFILSGIGKSGLVFTPGPAYMIVSSRRFVVVFWRLRPARL